MEIAPLIDNTIWWKLKLDNPDSPDWQYAIKILRKRIECRYLKPVDILIRKDNPKPATQRRYGFIVLAIDCLLIETLQAFKEGLTDTKNKSEKIFKNFLTTSPFFKKYFSQSLAQKFYTDYRCGILHQSEVKEKHRVWSIGPLIRQNNTEIIINRTKIHDALKNDFYYYLNELKDRKNITLRCNFRKKMDYISRKDTI